MEKPRPRDAAPLPDAAPAPAPVMDPSTPRVRLPTNRCPYCHDDVARETADVCRDCLARHHPGCWTEGARCGSCGSSHALRPAPARAAPPVVREREPLPERPGICPHGRCVRPGVARGPGPRLLCAEHAREQRRNVVVISGIGLLAGVLLAALGCAFMLVEGDLDLVWVPMLGVLLAGSSGAFLGGILRLPAIPARAEAPRRRP